MYYFDITVEFTAKGFIDQVVIIICEVITLQLLFGIFSGCLFREIT